MKLAAGQALRRTGLGGKNHATYITYCYTLVPDMVYAVSLFEEPQVHHLVC